MSQSQDIDFNLEVKGLIEMMDLLGQDVLKCQEHIHETDSNLKFYWRRIYTRAVFATLEGACEMLRKQAFAVEANIAIKGHVQIGKLSALAGESYCIDDAGEVRAQPIRTSFINDVLFSLKSYQEAQGVKHRTSKGDQWHRVISAVKVRHRVTHPKNLSGLEITDKETEDVGFTMLWFMGELAVVFREKGFELTEF